MQTEHDTASWGTLFYRHRYLLVLSIVVICVAGASSFVSLPRLEDPRIVHRNPVILTPVPGASAERVETLVTEPLEEALQEITAIKDIESTSRAGISVIAVELDDSVTSEINTEIFSEIRDKIGDVTPTLPAGVVPTIDDKRQPVAFTLIVGLRWTSQEPPELGVLHRLGEDAADRLRQVRGTELVRLYGLPEEEILVEVDAAELAEIGFNSSDLAQKLASADPKTPAGALRGPATTRLIEVRGELDSIDRVAAVPLVTDGERILRLGDVATIDKSWKRPSDEIGWVDGDRSVFIAARMGPETRVDEWAREVDSVLDVFSAELGGGLVLDRIFEQAAYTNDRLEELGANLIAGAAVVLLV
ncbi:MAG: efflux RND transporter permease subunit, partial [Planctomycetota bacterium]